MSGKDESATAQNKQNVTVPFQVKLDPNTTIKLQKLKLKMSSLNLMLAEFVDDVNSTITSLLVEINRSQTEKAKNVTVTNTTSDNKKTEVSEADRTKQ